jgi:transcription-repair coupling factor (superfamily II helicase)
LTADLSHNYITEPQHRIEIYRKLAQANEKSALENLQKELRDRFGPLPPQVELLLQVAELKILASEKAVTAIEVKDDKLMLTRHGDFHHAGWQIPATHEETGQCAIERDQEIAAGDLICQKNRSAIANLARPP